jgi:chromosome segregation ATPase
MGLSPEERERRLVEREKAVAASEAEASRLLAEARTAHRDADRERARVQRLMGRFARKMRHTLTTARTQLDNDRAALDTRAARFLKVQTEFHTASTADRERQRAAWADLDSRQKRLAAEWEEATRFHAEQSAALDARAKELAAQEKGEADAKGKLQRDIAALREEAAALDARARNSRQLLEELEHRRAELQAEALSPLARPGVEPPTELRIALDRGADRDLGKWTAELDAREEQLHLERAAVQALFKSVSAEKATLADRRRVLAEQFAELAAARVRWQEAERATVAEMEQLARTLRSREAELDARQERLARADSRRREDAYDLWQLRLRLEAWQSKVVAYEMQWATEREQMEAALARREAALRGASPDTDSDSVPLALPVTETPAVPSELATLREELERLAAVLLEAGLPEPPDPPDSELPWGFEDAIPTATPAEPDDADILIFDSSSRAA